MTTTDMMSISNTTTSTSSKMHITLSTDIDMNDYIFDVGGQCTDSQIDSFISILKIREINVQKFINGLLMFYAINGATNAASTVGFTVKYSNGETIKYTMQDLTVGAKSSGTTIRQICRKLADHTVELIKKSHVETRLYKKYKDAPGIKLKKEHAFDFANFTQKIEIAEVESLYKIKVNKLIRRKLIKKYEECTYVYKDGDNIIRDDKRGKELYEETIKTLVKE
jgi:hypothetical protein